MKAISPPVIGTALTAGRTIYPGWTLRALKNRLVLLKECITLKRRLDALFSQPRHERLAREVRQRPDLLGFAVWPFVHAQWTAMQRFEALSQHAQAMHSDMAALDIPLSGSLLVADMSEASPGVTLVIDCAPWCLREGSLVFNQFLGEERLMSLAFSFGWRDGERVAYIGSVQGSNVDSALEKYREIAKGLQGMRSRDFLIKSFQILTHHLGVKQLLGISDAQRHHRHAYFGGVKEGTLHLNYDEIWEEHAGERTPDGFYRLPPLPVPRPMETIAAKNRALYRRRHAMLDALSADIATRFGSERSNALTPESELA